MQKLKKYYLLIKRSFFAGLISLLSFSFLFSQTDKKQILKVSESKFDISAGMGIKAISASDLIKYLNSFAPLEKESDVSTAAEFFIAPEFEIGEELGIKIDYQYLIKSYNKPFSAGSLSISYEIHSPTIMIQYLMKGEGYNFKLGGGIGYYFGTLVQKLYSEDYYYANGFGMKFEFSGHTTLGGNLYALISANLQAGFLSELTDKNDRPIHKIQKVSLGFLSAGLDFGVAYYF